MKDMKDEPWVPYHYVLDDFIKVHSSHIWMSRNDNIYCDAKCSVCSIHVLQFFGKLYYGDELCDTENFPTCTAMQMRKALL